MIILTLIRVLQGAPMYVESISRILLTAITILALSACGGGGGGGAGGSLVSSGASSSSGDGSSSTGSITLSISGMVDESGNADNILAGNEVATLTAEVQENGSAAELVVLFTTTSGTLLQSSDESEGGTASVQIAGGGVAGAATVTATATLSDGTEISDSITVQMSADAPALELLDSSRSALTSVELLAAESVLVVARVVDWDGSAQSGVGVNFTADAVSIDATSASTNSSGEIEVNLTGTTDAQNGTFSAAATFGAFELSASMTANSVGVNTQENRIALDAVDAGSDGVLDGNEQGTVSATVYEDGTGKDGVVVTFSLVSGTGTLSPISATSAGGGIVSVTLIGAGDPGTAEVRAEATLSNGIAVEDTILVQTSGVRPGVSVVVRDQSGAQVTSFGANQDLTLEATITDHDGSTLSTEDEGVSVTFEVNDLGTTNNTSAISAKNACPVNGIQAPEDCAWVSMVSNSTVRVADITVSATINGIDISDTITVENTGVNSGATHQDGFTLRRLIGTTEYALGDVVAIEGDQFENTVIIRVDLSDFDSNPVPDGTLVSFETELGDIENECETLNGQCDVTFTSSEPRAPLDSEVSFRRLDVDNCPTNLIVNEQVTINAGGNGLTDYRVDEILRVNLSGTNTIYGEPGNYLTRSHGIECVTCLAGQVMEITYRRLWLDEEDDASESHVIATPGVATAPFLDVTHRPCSAPARSNLVEISGSIDPIASTSVGGVGTAFESELAVGDRLKVGNEIRTVASIASDTSLQVDVAFSDTGNDLSPERIAAPEYLGGMGQPYGGRSSIIAYAVGEESFIDTNGNNEYDFGERFTDLTEVYLDKNEDGVLGDGQGDSATAGTLGPYRDAGLGTNAPSGPNTGEDGFREKSNPYCYGPVTITGNLSSSEQEVYCYMDGGEEDRLVVDRDGDGFMDVGNGIYNGSRCLNPLQDADGVDQGSDGNLEDDLVCSTDLVTVSHEALILMSGTAAQIDFRAGTGGTFVFGEVISAITLRGGLTLNPDLGDPTSWAADTASAVTLGNSHSAAPNGGALINTTGLSVVAGTGDNDEEVSLFTITDPFGSTAASYTVSFDIVAYTAGAIDVFIGGTQVIDDCALTTCTATGVTATGDIKFVVGDFDPSNGTPDFTFVGTITNVSVSGTTTGGFQDFTSDENLVSNDLTDETLTDFNIGDTIDATTVFRGVSQRTAPSGSVPGLTTTLTSGRVIFTDIYNGELPRGTTVKLESTASRSCELTSVGGVAVTGGTRTVTVGPDVSTSLSFTVGSTTDSGSASIIATVTAPSGTVSSRSISCSL